MLTVAIILCIIATLNIIILINVTGNKEKNIENCEDIDTKMEDDNILYQRCPVCGEIIENGRECSRCGLPVEEIIYLGRS